VLSRAHIVAAQDNEHILTEFTDRMKQPKLTRGMPMVARIQAWIRTNRRTADEQVLDLLEETCDLKASGTENS